MIEINLVCRNIILSSSLKRRKMELWLLKKKRIFSLDLYSLYSKLKKLWLLQRSRISTIILLILKGWKINKNCYTVSKETKKYEIMLNLEAGTELILENLAVQKYVTIRFSRLNRNTKSEYWKRMKSFQKLSGL